MSLLISPAYAQTVAGFSGFDPVIVIEVVLIGAAFYFLMFRPQQQKAKQHRERLAALRRGDRVVTSGGMIGTIYKIVSDTELLIEIADGVRVRMLRSTVTEIVAKTEPGASNRASNDDDEEPATTKPKPRSSRRGSTPPASKPDNTGA